MTRVYNVGYHTVNMVVAQPCEKYNIFYYSHVTAKKWKTRCYMTLVRSEHSKMVDVVLELEIVGEPCVLEHTHLCIVQSVVSPGQLYM